MDFDQAKKIRDDTCRLFVEKKRLLLTVEVRTEDEAEQIMQWMYGKEKPMTSNLVEVSWDKAVVPSAVAEAIETIRRALSPY